MPLPRDPQAIDRVGKKLRFEDAPGWNPKTMGNGRGRRRRTLPRAGGPRVHNQRA